MSSEAHRTRELPECDKLDSTSHAALDQLLRDRAAVNALNAKFWHRTAQNFPHDSEHAESSRDLARAYEDAERSFTNLRNKWSAERGTPG